MGDGFVYFIYGSFEFFAGNFIIAAKALLKGIHIFLKMGYIQLLILGCLQLLTIF